MSHVPAWKRLGLELKRPQPQDDAHISPTKKRKTAHDSSANSNSSNESRKQPPHPQPVRSTLKPKSEEHSGLSENLSAINATKAPPKGTSTKAKKVSFSADTKDPVDDDILPPPIDDSYYTEPAIKQRKAIKRQKRGLRRQPPVEQTFVTQQPSHTRTTTPNFVPAYLAYLDDFSKGTNWKFNKTQQTKLLDNIYSIPSDYDKAVCDYIKGLKGQGARERLRADSQQIVSEARSPDPLNQTELTASTDSDMDKSEDREREVAEAMVRDQNKVKRAVEQSEEEREERSKAWQLKVEKRRKAELILLALAAQDDEQSKPDTEAQAKEENGTPNTILRNKTRSRGRKRKLQTGVPDDDDISSDSSSSDESPDESSEGSSEESSEDEESEEDGDGD